MIYYISNNGNDSNSGTSQLSSWETLSKVNSTTFASGDTVLFKRGDSWYGTIIPKYSATITPINYGAYSSGENPVITGFTTVTSGWTNEGGGIYSKIITSESQTNMVLVDEVQYAMGRYPNAGSWLIYESVPTDNSITDNQLTGTPNWTGAEACIYKNGWEIDRTLITNHTGNTITFTNLGGVNAPWLEFSDGKYFIQNDLRTLDTYGEWYHDYSGTGKFYMYFGAADPNIKTVKVATLDNLFRNNNGRDYISIADISFYGCSKNALQLTTQNDNLSVLTCSISYIGLSGIVHSGANGTINGCIINNVNGLGIFTLGINALVINNTVENIGLLEAQGSIGTPKSAIYSYGENATIQYNRVDSTAFSGIVVHINVLNILIANNYIANTCIWRWDIGSIYISGDAPKQSFIIENNIIIGTGGAGVYLDMGSLNASNGVIARNNSIAECAVAGIKINSSKNHTIIGNTVYNCVTGLNIGNWTTVNCMYGHTISNNIVVARTNTQAVLVYVTRSITPTAEIASYIMDNNIYARPIDDNLTFRTNVTPDYLTNRTLAQWKTFSGKDTNSIKSPQAITVENDSTFEYNPSDVSIEIILDYPMIDMLGNKYNSSITLDPWTSVILIRDNNTTNTYYVSNTGDDSNYGLSPLTPWQTISKVNAKILYPGNKVLFKKGDSWYGTLDPRGSGAVNNPITYGSYGSGNKPIITGFTTITGWTNEGNGLYSKVISAPRLTNMVTIDGVQQVMGRYPNTGYLTYESFNTNISITDNQLTSTPNWTGAEMVLVKNGWEIDRTLITNHSGSTITYTDYAWTSPCNLATGGLYFIQNDIRTLDTLGDWYHNVNTNKFYMYFGAVDPTSKVVKVATLDNVINDNSGSDYVIIDGINSIGSIQENIKMFWQNDYLTIKNCTIDFSGTHGIRTSGASTNINNCEINDVNSIGIYTNGTNSSITYNTIIRQGLAEGQGSITAPHRGAIHLYDALNAYVANNTIIGTGYDGIMINSNSGIKSTIKNNFIQDSCILRQDQGAIYTSGDTVPQVDVLIEGNIIIDSRGDGIYTDEYSVNVRVINNVVAGSGRGAIFLHKASNGITTGNILFNNSIGLKMSNWESEHNLLNNVTTNNISVSKSIDQASLRYITRDINYLSAIASNTFNYNYYTRPIDDVNTIRLNILTQGEQNITLEEWKTLYSKDGQSKKSAVTILDENDLFFAYNFSDINNIVNLPYPMVNLDGVKVLDTVTILPYSAVILIKDPEPTISTFLTAVGPSSGIVNEMSNLFTISNNGSQGIVTVSFSGVGSTGLSSIDLEFDSLHTTRTFSITPLIIGDIILSISNDQDWVNPSDLSYLVNAAPVIPVNIVKFLIKDNRYVCRTVGDSKIFKVKYYTQSQSD